MHSFLIFCRKDKRVLLLLDILSLQLPCEHCTFIPFFTSKLCVCVGGVLFTPFTIKSDPPNITPEKLIEVKNRNPLYEIKRFFSPLNFKWINYWTQKTNTQYNLISAVDLQNVHNKLCRSQFKSSPLMPFFLTFLERSNFSRFS